jgi:BON domain
MASTPVLQASAAQVLRSSPLPVLRKLAVEETDREVVLSGSVNSYYLKQLAQETVLPVIGGRRLLNRVQVERDF